MNKMKLENEDKQISELNLFDKIKFKLGENVLKSIFYSFLGSQVIWLLMITLGKLEYNFNSMRLSWFRWTFWVSVFLYLLMYFCLMYWDAECDKANQKTENF